MKSTKIIALGIGLLLAGAAQAAVYDIGANATVAFAAGDALTNTNGITAWTDSTLDFVDGSDLRGVDFTALGITSWTTAKFGFNASTTWGGADLSGLNLTFTGHNFGYSDSMVGTDFSGSTIGNGGNWNQFFLFSDVSYADFSGATLNITAYNGSINAFRTATLTGADFSDITWGIAASSGTAAFFDGGPGSTSVADKNLAANFSGADLSLLTGTAKATMIANLGTFDGGTPIGAKYNAATLSKSGWSAADLDAAGWQFAGDTNLLAVISASPRSGSSPLTVAFDAAGSSASAGIVSYGWNFGDGNSASGMLATNTYTSAGTYTAVLTITDSSNQTATASAAITVKDLVAQSGANPIVFDQTATNDNLVVLMAAGSEHSDELTVYNSTNSYPKHFWIGNFDDVHDVLQWTVFLETGADYHVDALLSANAGETFNLSVTETGALLDFSKTTDGWTKQDAGIISLPAGTNTLRLVRTSAGANVHIKSLELIRESDRADFRQRIADFKVDTTWFSQAGYGLMFQYGAWGYPETGAKKSMEDQANDFDVPAFVEMVKGTGASYVIWSTTWIEYLLNAPISSVDDFFGHGDRTSSRDLIGEIMDALDEEGINFMLYYHRGQMDSPWFADAVYPKEEFSARGTGDRSAFFDSWVTIITEIGNRYGDQLDGWFIDGGLNYYPAPFERMGAAARAGNPNRLVSYNPWICARYTDFQDVMFGEGHKGQEITGSATLGGDGILSDGPSAGLLQHGMFTMENTWGVYQEDQPINTQSAVISGAQDWVERAMERNVPISFNMMMWEDGTVSQDSLDVFEAIIEATAFVKQSGDIPIVFDQTATNDNLVVLMAAGSEHNEELTVLYPSSYPKHFWINNFDDTADYLQWTVSLETAADYHVDALLSANAGETFSLSVVGTVESIEFEKESAGWTKQDAGIISLPAGTSTLRLVRTSAAANVNIKSLELIRESDRADYLQRIADFKVDSTWFSQAGYGLMFQYGAWGYPETGDRKSLEDQANDFDVPAFVEMVKGTGASYIIWSVSWWEYLLNAPISSVDDYFGDGDQTSSRDLIGEIMTALDAEGIDFMLYYHRGQMTTPWFADDEYPKEEFSARGTGNRSVFFDSWETIITEIGNRYGEKLDGWFFDDGVVYYPAPFERLGAAARAGNPNRLVSYNPWIATRITDFQDVMMGEGHKGSAILGSAGEGGDGILTDGPSAGLLQHGMFIMEGDWGVHNENQAINTSITAAQAISYEENADALNVPISFCMMMWEDGTVSQDSLNIFNTIQFGGAVDIQATPSGGTIPLTVAFDASGTTSANEIVSYAWDFGDGNTATGMLATNTYAVAGDYTATLTVTDVSNHTASASVAISVFDAVIPGLSLSVDTVKSSTPPAFSTNDLAQTQVLGSSATGGNQVATEHAQLFNGVIGDEDSGTADSGLVTLDSSNTFTVELNTSVNTNGYDITGIDSIFGWSPASGGRANQGYAIILTFVDDSTATLAGPEHWEPNSPASFWTKVSFAEASGGVMASGVKAVTFNITEDANAGGVVVGREIDIFGTPTVDSSEHVPEFLPGITFSNGNLNVQFTGSTGQHYRVETIDDLTASNAWQVVTDIVSVASSPIDVSVPMTNGAAFYRILWLP